MERSIELIGAMVYDLSSWKLATSSFPFPLDMGVASYFFFPFPLDWIGGRDRVVCQHLDLDDVVPRPHWMMLCTHECLFSMQADGPRFDERSCEGLVGTQADNRRHAD